MHTNYTELAIRTGGFGVGYCMCGLMHSINWCLCGMHCHRVWFCLQLLLCPSSKLPAHAPAKPADATC